MCAACPTRGTDTKDGRAASGTLGHRAIKAMAAADLCSIPGLAQLLPSTERSTSKPLPRRGDVGAATSSFDGTSSTTPAPRSSATSHHADLALYREPSSSRWSYVEMSSSPCLLRALHRAAAAPSGQGRAPRPRCAPAPGREHRLVAPRRCSRVAAGSSAAIDDRAPSSSSSATSPSNCLATPRTSQSTAAPKLPTTTTSPRRRAQLATMERSATEPQRRSSTAPRRASASTPPEPSTPSRLRSRPRRRARAPSSPRRPRQVEQSRRRAAAGQRQRPRPDAPATSTSRPFTKHRDPVPCPRSRPRLGAATTERDVEPRRVPVLAMVTASSSCPRPRLRLAPKPERRLDAQTPPWPGTRPRPRAPAPRLAPEPRRRLVPRRAGPQPRPVARTVPAILGCGHDHVARVPQLRRQATAVSCSTVAAAVPPLAELLAVAGEQALLCTRRSPVPLFIDRDPKHVNCKVEPFESLSTKTFTLSIHYLSSVHDHTSPILSIYDLSMPCTCYMIYLYPLLPVPCLCAGLLHLSLYLVLFGNVLLRIVVVSCVVSG